MKMISLTSQARAKDKTAKDIRRDGFVPCVLYGNDTEHTQFSCEYSELYRVYAKAGESVLVDIDIDGKSVPSLFHSIDFAPVSDKIIHVDFYAVDMKKEIEAKVPLTFVGEAPAIKDLGGVMVTVLDSVTVKCLPTALPQHLDIDATKLADFTSSILVSDISTPDGVTIVDDPESMVATAQEPRKEAEPEVAAEGEAEAAADGEASAEGEQKEEGGEEKKEEGGEKSQ